MRGSHLGNGRVYFSDTNSDGVADILQESHYHPFGMEMEASYFAAQVGVEGGYKYNGKELNEDFGLNWYDYGARWYMPDIGRWGQVDPLAERYSIMTPYCYVGNMPLTAVDPEGKRIIFVNGYLGFGSPEGGSAYFGGEYSGFVQGAKNYFGDNDAYFTNIEYGKLSTVKSRQKAGKKWAKENYDQLVQGLDQDKDDFKFVTHSMGAAFGEGVIRYLKQMGWNVSQTVHFNAFQAADIEASTDPPYYGTVYNTTIGTFVVDYQTSNDWVINEVPFVRTPGDIKNATVKIREESDTKWDARHRTPIDNDRIWSDLATLIGQALQRQNNTKIIIRN